VKIVTRKLCYRKDDRAMCLIYESVGLIVRAISFQDFQPMWS